MKFSVNLLGVLMYLYIVAADDPVEDVNKFSSAFLKLNDDKADIFDSLQNVVDTAKVFGEQAGGVAELILKSVKGQIGPDKPKAFLAMENLGKLVVKAFTRLAGAVQSLEAAVHYYQMMALYFQDVSTPVGMLGKDLIYVSWNNGSMSYNFLKDDCERYSPREVLHKINAFMVTNCQFLDLEAEITKENMIYAEAMKFFVAFETKFGSPKDVTELTNFNSIKLEIITNLCRMRMSTANKNIEQLHKFINKPLKMFESPYDMIKEMKTRLDPVQWRDAFCYVTTVVENFSFKHQQSYASVRRVLKDTISASLAGVLCSSVLYEDDPAAQINLLNEISGTLVNVSSFTKTLLGQKLNDTWDTKVFESVVESTAIKYDIGDKKQWNVTARKIRDELAYRGLDTFVYQIVISEYSTSVEDVTTSLVLCKKEHCFLKSIGIKANIYVSRVSTDSLLRISNADLWYRRNRARILKGMNLCYWKSLPEINQFITDYIKAQLIDEGRHHTVILLKKKDYAALDWIQINVGYGIVNNWQGEFTVRNNTYYYPGWPVNRNYRVRIIYLV